MEKFYGEVFSRLQKHIKTIEKKQGAWMFTLIISGAISLFSYMLWMRISPPNSSKDFLNLSLPLSYFSKTVLSPFSCVLSFWVATSFLKKTWLKRFLIQNFWRRQVCTLWLQLSWLVCLIREFQLLA